MTLDQKFASDCDQSFSCLRWLARGAAIPLFVVVGLMLMGVTLITSRATVVSIAPASAALYADVGLPVNLRGLSIAKLHVSFTQQTEGPGELLITGEIENLRDDKTSVPDLRLALRSADGRDIYVWTTRGPKPSLDARERVPFRARLAAPPPDVRDVLVKFSAPGDKEGQFTESSS